MKSILNKLYSERNLGIWGIDLDIQPPCPQRRHCVCRNLAAYMVGRRTEKGECMMRNPDIMLYLDAVRLNIFFFSVLSYQVLSILFFFRL